MKTLTRETNTITIATFWENHLLKKYNYNPPYQRKSIWSDEKKSFLIDSILNNYPIPPIFLHQKIDNETGKTSYDVIDGKQRLDSIVQFIENKIPTSSEIEDENQSEFSGCYFKEFDSPSLAPHKSQFWKYSIPIEYVDSEDWNVIDDLFDRLNRNGEPLQGQELRNSKYYNSPLLKLVTEFSKIPFWNDRLMHLDVSRMEDLEFISELVFELLEGKPLSANQKILDSMYEKHANPSDPIKLKSDFEKVTDFMRQLDLDYSEYKITGVSHLYGIWCLSSACYKSGIEASTISELLKGFFVELRSIDNPSSEVLDYKKSMSSRTKSEGQRRLRLDSLMSNIGLL
ncbi:MAG: DUF262 domain-containing protein [Verrucomicrobiota bacterium]